MQNLINIGLVLVLGGVREEEEVTYPYHAYSEACLVSSRGACLVVEAQWNPCVPSPSSYLIIAELTHVSSLDFEPN